MYNKIVSVIYQIIAYYWSEKSKGYEPEIIFESPSLLVTRIKYNELYISDDCPMIEISKKIVYQDGYSETEKIESKD